MEQKRVSFKVAKTLKEAGYNEPCDMYYHIYNHSDIVYSEYESQMSLEATGDGSKSFLNALNHYRCAAPTYIDAWLWLRREKKIYIELNNGAVVSIQGADLMWHIVYQNNHSDPEEAIIAAIEYLVEQNLLN